MSADTTMSNTTSTTTWATPATPVAQTTDAVTTTMPIADTTSVTDSAAASLTTPVKIAATTTVSVIPTDVAPIGRQDPKYGENMAKIFALALFVFLLCTALIALIHWLVKRTIRLRAIRKANPRQPPPDIEKPEDSEKQNTDGQIAQFPNDAVTPYRTSSRSSVRSRTASVSPKSKVLVSSPLVESPTSLAPKRSKTTPFRPQRRRNTASSEFTLPTRSNTQGSMAPSRPSQRPPPLDLPGVLGSSPTSMRSGRSVFYTHNCPSTGSVGSSIYRQDDGHFNALAKRRSDRGDDDIMQYYPHAASASLVLDQQVFENVPLYAQLSHQEPMEPSYAHIKDLVRPGPYGPYS